MKYQAADALSGLPTNCLDCAILEDDIPAITVTGSNKLVSKSPRSDTADGPHAQMQSTFGNNPSTILKFIETERLEILSYCNQVCQNIDLPNTAVTYDNNGILMRKAPIDSAI